MLPNNYDRYQTLFLDKLIDNALEQSLLLNNMNNQLYTDRMNELQEQSKSYYQSLYEIQSYRQPDIRQGKRLPIQLVQMIMEYNRDDVRFWLLNKRIRSSSSVRRSIQLPIIITDSFGILDLNLHYRLSPNIKPVSSYYCPIYVYDGCYNKKFINIRIIRYLLCLDIDISFQIVIPELVHIQSHLDDNFNITGYYNPFNLMFFNLNNKNIRFPIPCSQYTPLKASLYQEIQEKDHSHIVKMMLNIIKNEKQSILMKQSILKKQSKLKKGSKSLKYKR